MRHAKTDKVEFKVFKDGAGELSQWLRKLAALAEDPGSIPGPT